MDRIGGLPDEILCHTLSFLSTKEAALTSLLSNRWRNLFALSPNLHLEDKEEDDSRSFSDFVDRVLAVSSDIPKRKFSLKCRKGIESAHINLWICNLLYRGGLLDLLHLDVIAKGVTPLPLEVFSCKTLVKLKLGTGFVIRMVPGNASLPALKTLFLDCIRFFNHHAFETLLSACHVLEELMIHAEEWEHCSKWYRTVSCKTLQRLTITSRNDHIGYSETCSKSITFDAPNLVYLDYAGYVPDEYLIVNLDSLVEAKLNLRWGLPNKTNPRNLIKGLRNVEILNLSTLGTLEIFYYFRQAIPVLEKLSCLSVKGYRFWFFFPFLLERSPNLETLVIEGPPSHYMCVDGVYEFTAGDSFILPVKVIELTRFWGISGEFKKLKSLVEKLAFLELVKVCAWANDKKAELKVAKDLQMLLPKACKIQLKFFSWPIPL